MSSNNREGSGDSPDTEMDMDTDRRDDRTDHGHRDNSTDTEMDMDTDRRDDRTDHGHLDDSADHESNPGERGKWLSLLIALLGAWMVASVFVLDVGGAHFWSDVLVGALLIGVGGYNYSRRAGERLANSAIALIAVAAGLWLIAAPYVLGDDAGLTEMAYDMWFYNHIAVGLLAAGLGALSAYKVRDHQDDAHRTKA